MEPSPALEQPDTPAKRIDARRARGRNDRNEPTDGNVTSGSPINRNIIPSSQMVSEKTMESYVPSSSPLAAEELTAYIGPKAERYRSRFERFTRTGTTRFELSWNNPAAFAGMWWYLYRKMYWWALVDFALSVLLGWTLFLRRFARRGHGAPCPARRRGGRQRMGHVGRHRGDPPFSRHPHLRLQLDLERDPAAARALAGPPGPLDLSALFSSCGNVSNQSPK